MAFMMILVICLFVLVILMDTRHINLHPLPFLDDLYDRNRLVGKIFMKYNFLYGVIILMTAIPISGLCSELQPTLLSFTVQEQGVDGDGEQKQTTTSNDRDSTVSTNYGSCPL